MKLHMNRKKRSKVKRFVSLALVCCLTLSMGSSYVSAGEVNPPAIEGGIAGQSADGTEIGQTESQGAGDADNNIEETPIDAERQSEPDAEEQPAQPPIGGNDVQPSESGNSPAQEGAANGNGEQSPDGGSPTQEGITDGNEEQSPDSGSPAQSENAGDDAQNPDGESTVDGDSAADEPGTGEPGTETETTDGESDESGADENADENFDDLPSIEELTQNPKDAAGATMLRMKAAAQPNSRQYEFYAYYVNQPDEHYAVMDNDFNLKYQMEFHSSANFEKGDVVIKIDAELFTDRNGNLVTPTEIGIPQGTMEASVANRSTPFNYYYEDGGKTLVFFNYKQITAGTNAAWQVLYRDQKLMDIVDGTDWTLGPKISVDKGEEGTFTPVQPLTGKADSWVALESVDKSYYTESGLNYTPGLYTLAQVQRYISGEVDDRFLNSEGRLDTANWHFVVWDVKVKGTATQPWNMIIKDAPGNNGAVVGYKDHSDEATAYKLPIGTTDIVTSEGGTVLNALRNQKEESWGNRFYVVTAYPAEEAQDGNKVSNDITIELVPVDKQDEKETLSARTATWTYEDYDWSYSGNIIGVQKETDKTVYTGWLDAYRQSGVNGKDYGDMPFTTTGHMYGYSYTHRVKGESEEDGSADTVGDYEYIPNTYYTLTTVDDFMYLYAGAGDGEIMSSEDYYFSGVTITQTDYGYDVWEDERVESELTKVTADSLPGIFKNDNGEIKSQVRIYAMLADPSAENQEKAADDGWVLIDAIDMDAAGRMEPYVFSENIIAQEPWRVKVEHDTIDYETVCKIDVKVRIQSDSPKMRAILEERQDAATNEKSPEVKFENISGVLGQVHQGDAITYLTETDGNHGSANYSEPGLKEATERLYKTLLIRDNAYRTVTWLNETAAAFKNARSTNDVDNNRVLVDYYLTAYDGYEIYNRDSLNYLREEDQQLISPGRSHVVFYDLLPYGMQFDASAPITAGRVTDLSRDTYQTQPKSWDGTQVTVTVDPERDIIANYRGTGRTMVAFHIAFSGADATSYTGGKWIEGWGVSFRAYYDWKDIDQLNKVEINANLCAFMPDFSECSGGSNLSHPALVGLKKEVDFDNGTHGDSSAEIDKAYADMVKAYQDENGNLVGPGNIDGQNLTDSEGRPLDSTYRNVLYAKNVLKDDVATASESKIEKLVRADSDRFGTFDRSTVVPVGEGKDGFYTYDITVTTATGIKDIVIFDRLEQAATDRKDTNDPFAAEFTEGLVTWSGTFQSLDTTALDKQGISYTAYYNEDPKALISQSEENPTEILTVNNGWYDENAFKEMVSEKYGESAGAWQDYVKAVAVRLERKGDKEYRLDAGSSVSFRIKMKAPRTEELKEGSSLVTYNNSSFSSVAVNDSKRSTVTGNSVKVTISNEERLEIVKETSGAVPAAREDEAFEFRLYEQYEYGSETVEQYLAFTEYKLYKLSGNDGWVLQDGLYATDGNGYLYLHAGEKAVFEAADAGRIQVRETENVFWDSEITETEDTADGKNIRTLTVTNTYRPVLYMRKNLSAVPEGVDVSGASFTFKVEIKRNNNYVPLADAKFWYVDSVRLDGGIPGKIRSDITGEDGTFTIGKDDIVALFPGAAGTEYRVSEVIGNVGDEETEDSWDWVCELDHVTGTMTADGVSRSIANYYRWKDLLLTKDITHQTKEDYDQNPQPFTFSISEVRKGENGEEVLTPVAGKEWELLDNPVSGNAGTEDGISGVLDEKGRFTCAMGFRTVRIKGLEAGKTYRIVELTEGIGTENGKPLYVPANDGSATATMPVYSTRRDVTIINDYQKRPLSVKKTVVGSSDDEESADEKKTVYFRFTATVNGTPLAKGTPYAVTGTGTGETVMRHVGVMPEGEEYSFAQGVSELGENQFVLADGETAVFQDAGMIGDEIVVTEVDSENQIYPADKGAYEDTLSEEGAEASFVNGESGSLLIRKEYVGLDEIGSSVVENLKNNGQWDRSDETGGAVEFVLTITDEYGSYTWPEVPVTVDCIEQDGSIGQRSFEPGDSIRIEPWVTLIIPTGENTSIPSNASYTLVETEEYQQQIKEGFLKISGTFMRRKYWMQISQSSASDALAKPESVISRPSATICNEVSCIAREDEGSVRGKIMTPASDEVPEGKKLVWRVEQYDKASGAWFPADGISYVILCNTREGQKPVSEQVELTEADGRIILTQLENAPYLQVWFPNDIVYLNLYAETDIAGFLNQMESGKPLLRMVEVPEESDEEWGMLVGYQKKPDADSGIIRDDNVAPEAHGLGDESDSQISGRMQIIGPTKPSEPLEPITVSTQYGMDTPPQYATDFVNSNSKAALEVEKYMAVSSDTLFTMILEQIVSVFPEGTTITSANYNETIAARRPASGIPYTIYNTDGSMAGNGVTGSGGEIQLETGQYASLEVPDNTMWLMSEKTSAAPNFKLKDLQPDSDDERMTKLNDNLMLINLSEKAIPVQYTVEWYLNDGTLLNRETRNGVVGQSVSVTENDTAYRSDEGYVFIEDDRRNVRTEMLSTNRTTALKLYFGQKVTYRVTRRYYQYGQEVATVTGGEQKGLVGSVITGKEISENNPTWNQRTIDGYNIKFQLSPKTESITLSKEGTNCITLIYENDQYVVLYTDGVPGQFVFSDKSEYCWEGDSTPRYGENPEREGYDFMDWTPAIAEKVDGACASKVNGKYEIIDGLRVIKYTATWRKE